MSRVMKFTRVDGVDYVNLDLVVRVYRSGELTQSGREVWIVELIGGSEIRITGTRAKNLINRMSDE